MPLTVYAMLGATALAIGLFFSVSHNFKLSNKLENAKQEIASAKAETQTLVDADKRHAKELAKLRKESKRSSSAVAALSDDSCLDRSLSPDALSALGVHPKDGKAKPAGSGGRKRNP